MEFRQFNMATDTIPDELRGRFDAVYSKRMLINVKGAAKDNALRNIHALLAPGGRYYMMECFLEPLARINEIRESLGLAPIQVKSFNEYLDQPFLDKIREYFDIEDQVDYESLYYFISRVFNAALAEGEPDYHAPMNLLAVELTKRGFRPLVGYSPEMVYVLKKK